MSLRRRKLASLLLVVPALSATHAHATSRYMITAKSFRNCPWALPPGPRPIDAILETIRGNIVRHNEQAILGYRIDGVFSLSRTIGGVRVPTTEYHVAQMFCGSTVASRTWVASVSFSHPRPPVNAPRSTESDDTEFFLARTRFGWHIWYQPAQA